MQESYKKPTIILKVATSIDGKSACQDFSSQWITNEQSRHLGHVLRHCSDAIMVGSNTAICDKPRLTCRLQEFDETSKHDDKLRVVLDTRGRVTRGHLVENARQCPTLIFTSHLAPQETLDLWKQHSVQYHIVPTIFDGHKTQGLDIRRILDELCTMGVRRLLVEGGPTLAGELLRRDLVDHLYCMVGNCVLGSTALPWVNQEVASNINDKKIFHMSECRRIGNDDAILVYRRVGSKPDGVKKTRNLCIVYASWHEQHVAALRLACEEELAKYNVKVTCVRVPGSYEIPFACARLMQKFDGFIGIGILVKGETMHFEYISDAVARGLMDLQLRHGKPVVYGILNLTRIDQVHERLSLGAQWGRAAWEMINLDELWD